LASSIVLAVLLSPLGFERRPPADLTLVGFISIGAVGAGILLDLAAIVLISRRARLASVLALVGSVAFLLPFVTDKTGVFFTVPRPAGDQRLGVRLPRRTAGGPVSGYRLSR
jgi:hypothetical protein